MYSRKYSLNNQRVLTSIPMLDYLSTLKRFGIRPGLETITELLDRLGNPHKRVKSVLVAGTNGKGSTCATLASILSAADYKVGLYTSPHLFRFNERIKMGNAEISSKDAMIIMDRIKAASVGLEVTYFEAATAMAFCYFATEAVDIAVLEVGMGGRLDATNVVDPLVSIITPISIEHTHHLGKTLGKIAYEKAGIIRPHKHVILQPQPAAARKVILERAFEIGAFPYVEEADWLVETAYYPTFSYRSKYMMIEGVTCGLRGRHQIYNAAGAIAATEQLYAHGFNVSVDNIKEGVENVLWPGRLETIQNSPLTIFDSAHNPAAARVLKTAIKEDFAYDRLHLVTGMLVQKDYRSFLKTMGKVADYVYATPITESPCHSPEVLAKEALKYTEAGRANAFPDLKSALETALDKATSDDLVLITGSLYLRDAVEKALT